MMQGIRRLNMNNPNVPTEKIVQGVVDNTYYGPEDTIADGEPVNLAQECTLLTPQSSKLNLQFFIAL